MQQPQRVLDRAQRDALAFASKDTLPSGTHNEIGAVSHYREIVHTGMAPAAEIYLRFKAGIDR